MKTSLWFLAATLVAFCLALPACADLGTEPKNGSENPVYAYPLQNLRVAEVRADKVVLEWEAYGDWTSFRIYRNGVLIGSQFKTSRFTDVSVVPGATYRYYVTEVNFSLERSRTGMVTATIP